MHYTKKSTLALKEAKSRRNLRENLRDNEKQNDKDGTKSVTLYFNLANHS